MKREDLFESIEKQIFAENVYRKQIRNKLNDFKILKENKNKMNIILEKIYREKIRKSINKTKILFEKKKNILIHPSTGMNALEDLFSNSNILSVLQNDYKILTTSYDQRIDYRETILNGILNMFKMVVINSKETKKIEESLIRLYEQEEADIQITLDDEEIPEDKIVGPRRAEIEDEKEQKLKDSENAASTDPNKDNTGKLRAEQGLDKIKGSIETAYNTLQNKDDKLEFKIYLFANLKMYFKQFEESLSDKPKADLPKDSEEAIKDAEEKMKSSESDTDKSEDVSSAKLSDENGLGF